MCSRGINEQDVQEIKERNALCKIRSINGISMFNGVLQYLAAVGWFGDRKIIWLVKTVATTVPKSLLLWTGLTWSYLG